MLRGRNVVIWSDNTGAEAVVRRGTAVTFDHCCLTHALWKRFAELRLAVWVERVPTAVNIADDPSRCSWSLMWLLCLHACRLCVLRGDYFLLENLRGSRRVEAKLDRVFREPQTWESISVVTRRGVKRKHARRDPSVPRVA